MSTIYQKTNKKTLILSPKECLIYPFDLGDWSQIRIGIECYLTASSGFNFTGEPYHVNRSSNTNPENAFFFGIINTGDGTGLYPFRSGVTFIGLSAGMSGYSYPFSPCDWFICKQIQSARVPTQIADSFLSGNGVNNRIYNKVIISNDTSFNSANSNSSSAGNQDPTFCINNSGALDSVSTNYVYRNGLLINVFNRGISGLQSGSVFHAVGTTVAGNTYSDPSINGLRSFLSTMETLAINSQKTFSVTGALTSNLSVTGTALPLPNSFFINNPFPNLNITISNLLIEKYA